MTRHYQDLTIKQGQDADVDVQLYATDGSSALDLTGVAEILYRAKYIPDPAFSSVIEKKKTTNGISVVYNMDPTNGTVIRIHFLKTDTIPVSPGTPIKGFFWHELWTTDGSGNQDVEFDGSLVIEASSLA